MSTPIKIVVSAQTEQAANELRKFLETYSGQLGELGKAAGEAGKHTEGLFSQNRMALMELEHVARSTMDALIAGLNPIRTLAMEAPRIAEASANMSGGLLGVLTKFLPVIGGIAAAVTAGAIAWHFYGDALIDPQKRAKELADELEKIPGILGKIELAQRAGTITPAMADKYKDMLSGKTPLYNKTTVADAFGGHAQSIGTGMFGLTGDQIPQLTTDPYERNSRTRQTTGMRQPANTEDIAKYVESQMRSDKTVMANNDTNPGTEALAKLHDLEMKIQRDAEIGPEKEIARIHDRYEIERREISQTRDVAQAAHKWTADEEAKYQATITASKIAEAASIAEIQEKTASESASKIAEEQKRIQEAALKDGKDQIAAQEESITAAQDAAGSRRGQLALQEYVDRVALYTKLAAQGKMSEAEYSKAVSEAMHKAVEGVKQYAEELKKAAQLKLETARAQTEGQLALIQGNPNLTKEQKDQQSLPLYQQQLTDTQSAAAAQLNTANTTKDDSARLEAMKSYYELQLKSYDLQNKIAAAAMTFGESFKKTITDLQNQWGSWAQQVDQSFTKIFDGGISSISSGITKLIEGTTTWHKALLQIGSSILNEIISSIVQMGVRWVMTHAMMAIAGQAMGASAVAASAPIAAAQSMIWATPATLSTIATYGASAAAAPGLIAGADAATLGIAAFAAGGRPAAGVPALVGERGPELFVPDSAGTIIPADKTAAMMSGGGSPFGGGGMGGTNVSVHMHANANDTARAIERDDAHEKWVVDVMRKNAHKFT